MLRYVFKRLLTAIRHCLSLSRFLFPHPRGPGGPFDLERPLDPKVMENLNKIYISISPCWSNISSI